MISAEYVVGILTGTFERKSHPNDRVASHKLSVIPIKLLMKCWITQQLLQQVVAQHHLNLATQQDLKVIVSTSIMSLPNEQ